MFKFVLFDLDGTLVRLDLDFFFAKYMGALAPHFARIIPPAQFHEALLHSTRRMVANADPGRTALEAFWHSFVPATGRERLELEPIFTRFYAEEFPRLRPPEATDPDARRLVRAVVDRGYIPVIATNPLFPRIAIEERLRWADCADFPFAYITNGEEMHFCKPDRAFFSELLERLGAEPGECLMVGNDVEEDLVASELGLPTALVTDLMIDRGQSGFKPDWRGHLSELADLFEAGGESALYRPRPGQMGS